MAKDKDRTEYGIRVCYLQCMPWSKFFLPKILNLIFEILDLVYCNARKLDNDIRSNSTHELDVVHGE